MFETKISKKYKKISTTIKFWAYRFYTGSSGVKTEKIRKGRIFGGVQGYLKGIFGDPSLTKILGKT